MPENHKLMLDTNFFIRFFTADILAQHQDCAQLIEQIQLGKVKAYLSNIVLLECGYILTKIYQVPKPQLKSMQQAMLELRNITLLEETNTPMALSWHWQTQVKLADCLIASQVRPGVTLCTYDQKFKKLPEIHCQTPAEILQSLLKFV